MKMKRETSRGRREVRKLLAVHIQGEMIEVGGGVVKKDNARLERGDTNRNEGRKGDREAEKIGRSQVSGAQEEATYESPFLLVVLGHPHTCLIQEAMLTSFCITIAIQGCERSSLGVGRALGSRVKL